MQDSVVFSVPLRDFADKGLNYFPVPFFGSRAFSNQDSLLQSAGPLRFGQPARQSRGLVPKFGPSPVPAFGAARKGVWIDWPG
jgi:hypothetical protein